MTQNTPQNRDSLIFYRSFYEAIKELPATNQLEIYNAIFELGFNFQDTELSGFSATVFKLIKPLIEANNKRFINGTKPKDKQKGSKKEAKHKQDKSKTEGNKDKDKEVNKDDDINDNEIIKYFNHMTGKNKYQSGKDRETVIKYVNDILKSGNTVEEIKNLIDYKLSNPNTQSIDLLAWLNREYIGSNMSKAKDWLELNKPKIIKHGEKPNYHTEGDFTGKQSGEVPF